MKIASVTLFMSLLLSCLAEGDNQQLFTGALRFPPRQSDPLEVFLSITSENVRNALKKGFPLLNLPPLDPLDLGNMTVTEPLLPEGFIDLEGDVYQLLVEGIAGFNLVEATSSLLQMKLSVLFRWPKLKLSGRYDLQGRLSTGADFYGDGPFYLAADEISAGINLAFALNSEAKIVAKNVSLILDVKQFEVDFDNLVDGGPIGDMINQFLSDALMDLFVKKVTNNIPEWNQTVLDTLNKLLAAM